jgi:hypothetical protein
MPNLPQRTIGNLLSPPTAHGRQRVIPFPSDIGKLAAGDKKSATAKSDANSQSYPSSPAVGMRLGSG